VGIATELDVIKRNSDRLNALVSALLTVSTEPRRVEPAPTDLAALVTDALDAHRSNASTAKVSLGVDDLDPVTAECDAIRVRQLVDNLISNAIKYTPAQGTVTVALTRTDDDAVLVVTDTGLGIDTHEQPLVFDRFFRGTIARQQAVQGVGVGLTIVKEAAEAHGGTVALTSMPGTGTSVTVSIPLVATP
jgi:signal transduction histidine kinase